MLVVGPLFLSAAAAGFALTPLAARPTHNMRSGPPVAELMDRELMDGFGGCAPTDEPLGWKGAALATLGTYLWYLGTNTRTNAEREKVEGPGVRRRNILLVVLLQIGAANFRSGTARVCTPEERKQLVIEKLERKGFDKEARKRSRLE